MKKLLFLFFVLFLNIPIVKSQSLANNGLQVIDHTTYFTLRVPFAYDESYAQYDDFMNVMTLSFEDLDFFTLYSDWYFSDNNYDIPSSYTQVPSSVYDLNSNMNPGRTFYYNIYGSGTQGNNHLDDNVVVSSITMRQEGLWYYIDVDVILPIDLANQWVDLTMDGWWYSYYNDGGVFAYQSSESSNHVVQDTETIYNTPNFLDAVAGSTQLASDYYHRLHYNVQHKHFTIP